MSVLLTPEKGGLKAPNSSKKEKMKLPVISPEVGKSQKNLKYKPISTIKRKKKNINKNESLILLSDAEMKEKLKLNQKNRKGEGYKLFGSYMMSFRV